MNGGKRAPSLTETVLLATVARRFYLQGRSKLEIAAEFGVSRFKVARMLDTARSSNLVRVEFDLPVPVDVELSDELRRAYDLDRALVLEHAAGRDPDAVVRGKVGTLAARLLEEIVVRDDVIGLSWDSAVHAMTGEIRALPRCSIVRLCGVPDALAGTHDRSAEVLNRLTAGSGGRMYPVSGPLVLPDHRTALMQRRRHGTAQAFGWYRFLTKAVVGIGAWRPGESAVYDTLGEAGRAAISARGATAEVVGRLFGAEGDGLSTGLGHHVLAISHEELMAVPEVIAIGHGEPRAAAVDAVLRSGLVSTLVTDAACAVSLLALVAGNPPARMVPSAGQARQVESVVQQGIGLR